MVAQRNDQSATGTVLNDTISGALDTIVAGATELETVDRYKSAAQLKNALLAIREPDPA